MKAIKLGFYAIVLSATVIFSSCSSEDVNITSEPQAEELLKSFTVKKDLNGAYSLDFDLNDKATIDKVYDDNTNTNQFYLYSSNTNGKKKVSETFSISDSQLKIGFVDTNTDKMPSITITDENISFAKDNDKMLSSYEVTSNDDGLLI